MMDGLPVDLSTRIRKDACMMELRDESAQYDDGILFAARSLWFVIKTRLLDGLQDACDYKNPDTYNPEAHNLLMYVRSELGLAFGCGPRLGRYRSVMDFLGDVACGRAAMTRAGLLASGEQGGSSADDYSRIADSVNRFYLGARWHIIDAGYSDVDDDDDDDDTENDDAPLP